MLVRALPAGFNNAHDDGVKIKGGVAVPLIWPDPANGGGVRSCAECAAGDAAEIVGDNVVIADALVLTINTIEQFDELNGLDDEAGFFEDLTEDGGGEGFAHFNEAAGDGPAAFAGFSGALHKKHATAVHDHGADTHERSLGILSGHRSEPVFHWSENYSL
jgi:hypothetical protein